jgi:hypothetical protein
VGVVKIAKPALSRKALYSRFVTESLSSPLIVNLELIGAFGRGAWLDLSESPFAPPKAAPRKRFFCGAKDDTASRILHYLGGEGKVFETRNLPTAAIFQRTRGHKLTQLGFKSSQIFIDPVGQMGGRLGAERCCHLKPVLASIGNFPLFRRLIGLGRILIVV